MSKSRMIAILSLGLTAGAAAQTTPQTAAQVGSNSPVPRADFITTMDVEYRKMDGDKNGKVTRGEIEIFERGAALGQARARAQALFGQLDADRNGQLSQAEFARMVSTNPSVDGRPLLAKLDLNKDGAVTLIEHRAGKLAYFDQIDSDKDGVVTVVEMKAAGILK